MFRYGYDAWNRLTTVTKGYRDGSGTLQSGSVVVTMRYDGTGRRIQKQVTNSGNLDCTYHYYHDGQRTIEVRNGSDQVIKQYVWNQGYIDDLAQTSLNDDPSDGTEQVCESHYWSLCDSNYNVLAIVDSSGILKERYEYSPYGQRTVYFSPGSNDPDCYAPTLISRRWKVGSTLQPWGINEIGHQGLLHDEEIGLIYNRARELHPVLGRFTQRDPLGYVDGQNLYQYLRSTVLASLDPFGTNSAGAAVGVAVTKVALKRAALATALALGSITTIQQARDELEQACKDLGNLVKSVTVNGVYEVSDEVSNALTDVAKALADAAVVLMASEQAKAVEKCEQMQLIIDVHFGKLENGNPDPGGPWDHWIKEIRGWIEQQQAKLKRMGRKTSERWEEQIRQNIEKTAEYARKKGNMIMLAIEARIDDLIAEKHQGKTVVAKGTVKTSDGKNYVFRRYADGSTSTTVE